MYSKKDQLHKKAIDTITGNVKTFAKRIPINRDWTLEKTIDIMSERHPPTAVILSRIAYVNPMAMLHLDDMNMRGRQIYTAYEFVLKKNPLLDEYSKTESFIHHCMIRSPEMVNYVNQNHFGQTGGHQAVQRGGAPRGE